MKNINGKLLFLVLMIAVAPFACWFSVVRMQRLEKIHPQNAMNRGEMLSRIENLERAFKACSRTNWVVLKWEEGSDGVDLVTITDPTYGDRELFQIFVSQQYTDQLLGWVEGMIRPAVGRWSSHSLARLTGKKAVFNPIKSGPSYGHNLVFGGLLEFSVVN